MAAIPAESLGCRRGVSVRPGGEVEPRLGDVDPHEAGCGFHERSPGVGRATSRHGPALQIRSDPGDCSGSSPGGAAATTKLSHGL